MHRVSFGYVSDMPCSECVRGCVVMAEERRKVRIDGGISVNAAKNVRDKWGSY